jgi:hypothetical protein
MLKRTLVALTFMGGSREALAQQKAVLDTVTPRFTVGSTQIGVGYIKFDFADLDSRMAIAGLPRAASAALTVGVSTDIRYGALLLGFGFHSLISQQHSDASYKTSLAGRYTLADIGFAAVRTRGWSIYPIAGLGATAMSVYVREQGEFTFDEGLARPSRQLGMSGLGALAHGGLLIERRMHRGESEFALALRAGVTRGFGSQSWMSDMGKVNGGPTGLRSSYVRLAFSRPMRHRRDAVGTGVGTLAQVIIR